MSARGEVVIFPPWRRRFNRRRRIQTLRAWRGPLAQSDTPAYRAVAESLGRVTLLRSPTWKAAVQGDAAAAIGMAIDVAQQRRAPAQTRDLILSVLWLRAADGNPAALLTLELLKRHNGRLRT